jgi:hypothetical protein
MHQYPFDANYAEKNRVMKNSKKLNRLVDLFAKLKIDPLQDSFKELKRIDRELIRSLRFWKRNDMQRAAVILAPIRHVLLIATVSAAGVIEAVRAEERITRLGERKAQPNADCSSQPWNAGSGARVVPNIQEMLYHLWD